MRRRKSSCAVSVDRAFRADRLARAALGTCELLETRRLLTIAFSGAPTWTTEGPAPITSGSNAINVIANPGNGAGGATESVATRPLGGGLFQIYAGTVNGGVWRTNNADPTNPAGITWSPQTDQMPSLAMGDVAYSPLDATGNTLFAGTGSFSSLGQSGGPAVGVYRTTDGGATWQDFQLTGGGSNIVKTVLPTSIDLDAGPGVQEVVLVGTIQGGGLYRSNNNGQTWSLLSGSNGLPGGDVTQLIVDPNNSSRFYAAITDVGVYRGDYNSGTNTITWATFNTGLTALANAGNIQITAGNYSGDTVLYELQSNAGGGTPRAFRLDTSGGNTTWSGLANPPGAFDRDVYFRAGNFIIPDPTNSQIVYATTYTSDDHIFRYDPSGSGSWVAIMGGGGGPTRPHPDGRSLAFLNNTTLVDTNDGGIYFLPNPSTATAGSNNWQSFNGNTSGGNGLDAVEFHDTTYDSFFNVVVGGAQDNGTEVQSATGSKIWSVFQGGDGGDVAVDDVTLAGSSQSIRYSSSQDLGGLTRVVFDSASHVLSTTGILPNPGADDRGLTDFEPDSPRFDTGEDEEDGTDFATQFVTPFVVSSVAPASGQSKSLVVGGGGTKPVYEATMPSSVGSSGDVTWTSVPVAAGFGTVNALELGGRRSGSDNADVLYAGTENGLFVRTTGGGTLNATATTFPGGSVAAIAVDPQDWHHVFVASSSGVWESTDIGATWTNRTGDLSNSNIHSAVFTQSGGVGAVLVGGQGGIFRMLTNNTGVWTEYGLAMPNAVTYDLDYNAADDVLVAGTLGRGAWEVAGASSSLFTPPSMTVGGTNGDDTIKLIIDPNNPLLLDVFINNVTSTPDASVPLDAISQITVNGLGGNDTLIVDESDGYINMTGGISYDGGIGSDQLTLQGGTTLATEVSTATGPGAGNILLNGTTITYSNLTPVNDSVPVTSYTFNAPGGDDLINLLKGSTVQIASGNAGFEIQNISNKGGIEINGQGGNDTLTVDFSGGNPIPAGGLGYDGGGGSDSLTLQNGTFTTEISTASGPSSGTILLGTTQIAYVGLSPVNDTLAVTNYTFNATSGVDLINVVAGPVSNGFQTAQINSANGTFELQNVANKTNATVNAGNGSDTLNVTGSALAPIGTLNLSGQGGDDSISLTTSATTPINVDGGAHTVGDTLSVNGQSLTYTLTGSTFTAAGQQTLTYANVEALVLSSGTFNSTGTIAPAVIVSSAGVLAGNATILGPVTSNSGGTISPGVGSGNTAVINTGNLALNASSTYAVDINGTTAGAQLDQLKVTGNVVINSATLTGTVGYSSLPGDEIVIIDNPGVGTVTGTFLGLPQGAIITLGTAKFTIDYGYDAETDGNDNDVALIRYGAALGPDPCDPGKKALFVSATAGPDNIRVTPETGSARVHVYINADDLGVFAPSGHLILFGQAGDDSINVTVPVISSFLYGGRGNDVIRSGNGDSILMGNDDSDTLYGGNGKDILIGGKGSDLLVGGNAPGILIAGRTVYDTNSQANRLALCNILDQWQHQGGYETAIASIINGGGRNGLAVFNNTTVFNDSSPDTLLGGDGRDWFITNLFGNDITDKAANEIVTSF